jgi:hypothetical protein
MRRAIACLLAVGVLVTSVVIAHASALSVNAGVLQVQTTAADIDIPDDPVTTYTISVTGWRSPSGQTTTVSASVAADEYYTIGLAGTGDVVSCSTVNHAPPAGETERGPGTYQATANEHVRFCVQKGTERPTISPAEDPGNGP